MAVESTVDELYNFIDELHEEITEARTKVQTVIKDIKSANKLMAIYSRSILNISTDC